MKRAVVFLADGFEEIEGLTAVDFMRRAGIEVITASVMKTKRIVGAHNIELYADEMAEDIDFEKIDMLVLPGGLPGADYLRKNEIVIKQCSDFAKCNKYVAAICAAPRVLGKLGILKGKRATCYPGFEKYLKGAICTDSPIEIDSNIITGKGPGAATQFALALIEALCGKTTAKKIKAEICL